MDTPVFLEYTSSAVPILNELLPEQLEYNSKHEIKTPNLLAKYLFFDNKNMHQDLTSASSHVYYVLSGSGKTIIKDEIVFWNEGDVLTIPYMDEVTHISFRGTILFYVNDSPLLEYLNCKPEKSRFKPTYYCAHEMLKQIQYFNNEEGAENRNRNGILISNNQMVNEKINTLTHTMWSLLNSISPHTVQKPHKHNSIAIDLCIDADQDGKVYTLMGKSLDENGNVQDPIKMVWKKGCTFTTPPGWWHSHHNESDKAAWVFPVQDAGLHTFMRTLDIQFVN